MRTLPGHLGGTHADLLHPGGKQLAGAGMDRMVKLWDLETGEEALSLRGAGQPGPRRGLGPEGGGTRRHDQNQNLLV